MESLYQLIRLVYNTFIMRDLFAKVVPGSVVILSINHVFSGAVSPVLSSAPDLGFVWFILGAGVAWSLGFAMQHLTEITRMAPKELCNPSDHEAVQREMIAFQLNVQDDYIKTYDERFATIREALMNLSGAIVFSAVLALVGIVIKGRGWPLLVEQAILLLVILTVTLIMVRYGRDHWKRQQRWRRIALDKCNPSS